VRRLTAILNEKNKLRQGFAGIFMLLPKN